MSMKHVALGAGIAIAVLGVAAAAYAAPPADCYSGMWQSNEQLTKRTRPVMGPLVIIWTPWGENGMMRLHLGDLVGENAEMHWEKFDGKVYRVFGTDPREQVIKKVDDYTFETMSVRDGVAGDKTIIVLSADCKRMTSTVPEGVRRDTGQRYFNDVRVYDKVES